MTKAEKKQKEIEKKYIKNQKEKFKVGDKVKVVKLTKDFYRGWHNAWTPEMKKVIGKTFEIKSIDKNLGVYLVIPLLCSPFLGSPYCDLVEQGFPYYALKKVK